AATTSGVWSSRVTHDEPNGPSSTSTPRTWAASIGASTCCPGWPSTNGSIVNSTWCTAVMVGERQSPDDGRSAAPVRAGTPALGGCEDGRVTALIDTIRGEARELHDDAVAMRRALHELPEIGNELPITREAVLESLDGLPLDITLHESTSGVAGLLTGAKPGPTILLRGDMDALPLHEDTGLDFSSRIEGAMHACGHDTHTAMLASAAKLLSDRRDDLAGRVLFMFQPGEEGHHGARYMLDEGLLDLPPLADGTESPVTGAFALHIT